MSQGKRDLKREGFTSAIVKALEGKKEKNPFNAMKLIELMQSEGIEFEMMLKFLSFASNRVETLIEMRDNERS